MFSNEIFVAMLSTLGIKAVTGFRVVSLGELSGFCSVDHLEIREIQKSLFVPDLQACVFPVTYFYSLSLNMITVF